LRRRQLNQQPLKFRNLIEREPKKNQNRVNRCCVSFPLEILSYANKGCATHTMALPFTLKSILRQTKNYENSNISPCKKIIIFKKIPLKETKNPSRYHNSIPNLKFQHKPKYSLSKILI
jgi:hypothetical protein